MDLCEYIERVSQSALPPPPPTPAPKVPREARGGEDALRTEGMPCFSFMSPPRFLLQQMKTTTATMTVPQMAADAAMMIVSMCIAADVSVRISRHWELWTLQKENEE